MKARSFIALLLCALLLGGVLPASAFASEDPQKTEADNVLSESSAGENSDVLPIKEEDEPQEVQIEPTVEESMMLENDAAETKTEADNVLSESSAGENSDVLPIKEEDEPQEVQIEPTVEESMMLENDAAETETAEPKAAGPETAEPDTEAQEKAEPGQETVSQAFPAFSQNRSVNGVTVTVSAEAGAFPEDAVLSVNAVPGAQTEASIEEEREADTNVVSSYTFDIKILDRDGNEIQPVKGKTVNVSFSMAEAANENLDTQIYHISDDGSAEKLAITTEGQTITAETVGFSLYTVEFTYNSLQYVLPGDSSAAMSEILSEVGLSGEVSAVEISDTNLFSASNETGKWVVTAHQAFSTTEWMKVTIGGIVYEIQVTDDDSIVNLEMGYTLTLDENYSGALARKYENVTSMELPSLTRSGYLFQGWAESATGNVVYKAGDSITLTSDKTLFAVWGTVTSLIGGIPVSNGGYVYLGGIRWRVIGVSDSKWLLISANVLGGYKTWNDAKNYCGTVYDGFSLLEQAAVFDTTKTDVLYDKYAAANLNSAKLFLLSASEAVTYFSLDADRQPGWWWLRSPGSSGGRAGAVFGSGYMGDYLDNSDFPLGARPAFQLNLESVLFESAAEGGKPAANGNFSPYTVPTTAVDRKLTLIDSSRSGFSANVGGVSSATVSPGGTLAITYSGANIGENEYVSAMLTVGNNTYYASLTSDGSGTWNMTLPDDLTAGNSYTLKVFSEKQNEDNLTDYAGSPVSIALTVSGSAPATYAVTVTAGENMSRTDGEASQTVNAGSAMSAVVYTANEGYFFPTDYSVESVNGVSVTRNSFTQITVSGTPTADSAITLTAATAKTKPAAPTAPSATGCTTAENNDGKITGVTAEMEYRRSDAESWTSGTGSDITGLASGTYYVRFKATDTTLASDDQELTVAAYTAPEQVATPTFSPAEGEFSEAMNVTISCTTEDATIYYTTDGSTPTAQSTAYSEPISVSTTTTIKAIAIKSGWMNSEIAEATYTIIITPATYTVTYKVVNGTWSDGTTTDKTESVASGSSPASVPTDMIAGEGYTGGAWDVDPANMTITEGKTFIFTFDAASTPGGKQDIDLSVVVCDEVYGDEIQCIVSASVDGEYELTVAGNQTTITVKDHLCCFNAGVMDAGSYQAAIRFAGDSNYNPAFAITAFTVYLSGTTFEVSAEPGQVVEGGTIRIVPTLPDGATGTVKYFLGFSDDKLLGEKPVGEDLELPTSGEDALAPGTYAITAAYSGDGNYIPAKEIVLVTIIAKPSLTITVKPQTYTYNGQTQGEGDTVYEDPAEIAEKVSVEGLRDGDSLSNIIIDGQGKDADDYEIAVSSAGVVNALGDPVTDEYTIDYIPGTLTIEPAKVTITVDSASKAEGDDDPAFKGTVEGLVADGDLGEIKFVRTGSDEAVGTYTGVLTATYTENPNYKVTVVPGDFTIKALYTLRWLDGDGSVLQEKTYVEGEITPAYDGNEPTKAETAQYTYTFSGWDAGTTEGTVTTYKPLFNETMKRYSVTFVDYDGKTVLKEAISYDYGTDAADIALPDDPERKADAQYSYTFTGWDPEISEVTGDATYKATYKSTPIPIKKCTLTFDLAGGTLDGKTGKVTIEANVGDTIKLPEAPTREGYTFQYWKGSRYEAGADYKVEGDHTFTAVWEENKVKTYTVTFDANGHGTAPDSQTVEEGKKASKPKDPTASGYTFGGWFTDKECKSVYSFDTAVTKDITLYAKWTKNSSSSDDKTPSKGTSGGTSGSTTGTSAVKTGDENNFGLWFMLMAASLLALAFIVSRRRLRNR